MERAVRRFAASIIVCAAIAMPALAQTPPDLPGSRDHPLLSRYPGSYIAEYIRNFDAVEMTVPGRGGGEPGRERVEGDATTIRYFHGSPERQPSALQVIRNYQNAIRSLGGAVVFERLPREGDGGETTLRVATGGKDVWVRVVPEIFSAPTQSVQLVVVEVAAMAQVVTANELADALKRQGFVALYIGFDTGKWDLKPDGVATVREIVALMKADPSLKLAVEGHTDNVGTPAANKTLSANRANAVVRAVVAAGVEAGRMSAAGFGQERPVADNRTEEGRAKNRRVELVKR
ncbi:MAG: OmpA family protein [Burkholderiales bacterium]